MPLPVITVAQMREWEKATWASGQTEEAVMRRAGAAVAGRALRMTREGDLILALAGKGHNGDDTVFASEGLSGRQVKLLKVIDPEATAQEITPLLEQRPALIIDGLFGIGLNRSLALPWLKLIQQFNQSGHRILAVDVPSGLNADTGLPLDDAVRAACTVTFGAAKQGMLKTSAWPFVGRLEVEPDIGLIPYPFTTEISIIAREDFTDFPPPRPQTGHKGTFGHLGIIAGSLGYHGASVLASRGAQRAQPGLITLITAPDVYEPVARQLQAVMVRPWSSEFTLPETCTAVIIGPGLASPEVPEFIKDQTRRLWQESPLVVIVDASALAWLQPGPVQPGKPPSGHQTRPLRVITPHPGEAARMLDATTGEVQADRPGSLRSLSKRFGDCWVVLKGYQTIIGQSRSDLLVNCSGNPHLAQGGSGDLLSGFIGGLLAQPALQAEPIKTLAYAVWEHGAAADHLDETRPNWVVEDLAETLGAVR